MKDFENLSASRRKEVLRYLNTLRSKEAVARNIDKVVKALKKEEAAPLFRL